MTIHNYRDDDDEGEADEVKKCRQCGEPCKGKYCSSCEEELERGEE